MTLWNLIKHSLHFYWRTHLGVILGVAVSTAVLVGALIVGDSVRYSLRSIALSRLGDTQFALIPQDRYFRSQLGDELQASLRTAVAPILMLQGIVIHSASATRANQAQIVGVDERFWVLGHADVPFADGSDDAVILNESLAKHLGVAAGDNVLLRVEKPGLMPRDAPLATDSDAAVAMQLTVSSIISDTGFGNFSLRANQIPPFNAFVPLAWLQQRIELPGRANALLVGENAAQNLTQEDVDEAIRRHWQLADAEIDLRELPQQGVLELSSRRIFLDPAVAAVATDIVPNTLGVLTYFVNELRVRDRAAPYSMVTALGLLNATEDGVAGSTLSSEGLRIPPEDMPDDAMLINTWLAEDLQAKEGDLLQLTYYVVGPMRKLEEQVRQFRVYGILSMDDPLSEPGWMPAFPGLSDVENCRDWEPGIPIDLDNIRDKDEEYWDSYRGTPKAFITLRAGQSMWENRFGNLTALRFPLTADTRKTVVETLQHQLHPASVGLFFQPLRERALAASTQSLDFGQLFLGLSFFLIISALLLTGLLFVLTVEQRSEEMGTLLAIGFPSSRARHLFLWEGSVLAIIGGAAGVVGGILYTKLVLYGLSTVWRGAVAGSVLRFHAEPMTLLLGGTLGTLAALLVMMIHIRRQTRLSAVKLLTGSYRSDENPLIPTPAIRQISFWVGAAAIAAALLLVGLVGASKDRGAAGIFFASGSLLLVGSIAWSRTLLTSFRSGTDGSSMTLAGMGLRNAIRRRGRSLAIIALLACGSFLMIAISANRHDPLEGIEQRSSGTGGFALFGESALPVFHDLNTPEGRDAYGLDSVELQGVEFVPLRVHAGDDASCLNLNRAQTPQLLGVKPELLGSREAFTFVKIMEDLPADDPWLLLNRQLDGKTVPAIGDQATITWALGKSVGDTLLYTDERGNTFPIRLVGVLANSVLQGNLVISEDNFLNRFPSGSGYQMFLIDAPSQRIDSVSQMLSRALQDIGLELTLAGERLAMFSIVENTYLSIFQALGGLGLLLGTIGLGIVVLRNILERRSELALLRALGFERRSVQWLVLSEHWALFLLGLLCGVTSALVAVLPALRSPGANVPYRSLILTLVIIVVSGLWWIWGTTRLVLRGPLLNALRNE